MSDDTILRALRETLDRDPHNGVLWLHYAQLAEERGHVEDALVALRTAIEIEAVRDEATRKLIPLLRRTGQLSEALIRCEAALERNEDASLREELARIHEERGSQPAPKQPDETPQPEPVAAKAGPGSEQDEVQDDWADQFDWSGLHVTFDDVAGLDDVKRQVNLRIIAPFKNPEVYQAFGKEAGGGILLYGPPGCGKTFIARATAGELGARFCSVSIHEILDKYYGETEKMIHKVFEHARKESPTVLFFDEFDALGASRGGGESSFWRSLVNALLAEMDGMGGRNTDVLVCAATNLPWNVDLAFRRPGRFDRVLFVPPPDRASRVSILERRLERLPGGDQLDAAKLAQATSLFSGADLVALCERASEGAIDRSLQSGTVSHVQKADMDHALRETRSSIEEWLATARNYARYANDGCLLYTSPSPRDS